MHKRFQHIILLLLLLLSLAPASAQVAMPDTLCVGTSRIYQVNNAAVSSTYTWKIDGVTQATTNNQLHITWSREGVFLVTVQEHSFAGCDGDIRAGWVYVNAVAVANAGPDASVCFGTPYRLNGSGGNQYQWSPSTYLSNPNIPNPIAAIPQPGSYIYVLRVANSNGCNSNNTDSVTLTILPPARISAGRDTAITINQSLQLQAVDLSNSGFTSYHWTPTSYLSNPNIANPLAKPRSNIIYTVQARTDLGCEAKASISIKVFDKADIYVPNAFTPNADGLNDQLKAIPIGIVQFKYFSVFNRWGEMVFTTTDPLRGWDGIYKGQQQSSGSFTWMTEGIDYQGNIIHKKGFAVLIR